MKARSLLILLLGLVLGALLVVAALWWLGREPGGPVGNEPVPAPGQANGAIRILSPNVFFVTITSDPAGAVVTIDGERVGVTPLRVPVGGDRPVAYRVAIEDPALRPERYRPYEGTLDVERDASIAVWLDRR